MNKAQRKYVADFEANMAGKKYNIFDCITFATEYYLIDPKPDAEYIVLRGNEEIAKFNEISLANEVLLNTLKSCLNLPDHRLVKFHNNYTLTIERDAGNDKTQILTYTIVKEESLKEKELDAFFDQWPP